VSLVGLSSRVTRKSRSNFYYAFLALPRARREALYAVYAFCRTVDDIADLGTDAGAQRAGLAAWRRDIARCYEADGTPEHPIARQLATAVRQFGLPRAALEHFPVSEHHDACGELLSRERQTDIRADACRLPRGHGYDRKGIRARRNACPRLRRFLESGVHRSSRRIST